ncbi:hypothetical protein TNCV_1891881 [Trichonephila clavipes]|nr:hypothetical protein TNCV_1891881 [Trichonephila clavipes]
MTFELLTDLTCIVSLHGGSLVVLDSNSGHACHDPIPWPLSYRSHLFKFGGSRECVTRKAPESETGLVGRCIARVTVLLLVNGWEHTES